MGLSTAFLSRGRRGATGSDGSVGPLGPDGSLRTEGCDGEAGLVAGFRRLARRGAAFLPPVPFFPDLAIEMILAHRSWKAVSRAR